AGAPSQLGRLIETAHAQSAPMERNRNNEVRLGQRREQAAELPGERAARLGIFCAPDRRRELPTELESAARAVPGRAARKRELLRLVGTRHQRLRALRTKRHLGRNAPVTRRAPRGPQQVRNAGKGIHAELSGTAREKLLFVVRLPADDRESSI